MYVLVQQKDVNSQDCRLILAAPYASSHYVPRDKVSSEQVKQWLYLLKKRQNKWINKYNPNEHLYSFVNCFS